MFIDEAQFEVKAGKGGDGAVSFRRERFIAKGGPEGGDGGHGGDVILVGKHDEHTLSAFRAKKEFRGEAGQDGMRKKMHGKNGADYSINVPLGTLISKKDPAKPDSTWSDVADITEDGQRLVLAKGGNGGWGNARFATSIKQAPNWAKEGLAGEHYQIKLELQLIADVGLVGLPNAGKSTLLSHISNARPKIADYPFTTLEPQLGVVSVDERNFTVADIPGLIEGASHGKGLGDAFLRHIRRTKVLLYLLDGSSATPKQDFAVLKKELAAYDASLAEKPFQVAINKMDIVSDQQENQLKKSFPNAHFISAATGHGITTLLRDLVTLIS